MALSHTLVLMRHAKSDYPTGAGDFERPLAPRGRREAGLAGQWLRRNHPEVDQILCSSAVRAQQTAAAIGIAAPVRAADELYDASPHEILDQIALTAEEIGTLLVIGHAPGIPALTAALAGDASDAGAVDEVSQRFPTCAMAVVTIEVLWAAIDFGAGRLTAVHTARA